MHGRPKTQWTKVVAKQLAAFVASSACVLGITLFAFAGFASSAKPTHHDSKPKSVEMPKHELAAATAPTAPRSPLGTAGNGQVRVTFSAPLSNGGNAITSYTVTATPGGATASGAASPIIVTGLTNGTAYTFKVKATNMIGTGPESSASAAITPRTVPDAPSVTGVTPASGSVSVAFTAGASNGGNAVTSYTVTSSPGNKTAKKATSPITITGLTNGTAYTFTVKATNAAGTSLASDPSSSVTPRTIPSVPLAVGLTPGNGQVSVAFTNSASTGGSAITSYTVTANPGNITASGSSSPIVVSGLNNGTTYSFTVLATNAAGNSAKSAAKSTVPRTVPGQPRTVTATPGNARVSVAFLAPTTNGGNAITSYTVTSDPGGITASGKSSPIAVLGLTNGTEYTFTVKATNAAGASIASDASNAVTARSVPGAPTSLVATPGMAQASVAFTAPVSNGGSAITGYKVTSNPGGKTATGASSPLVVNGLSNGMTYTFTAVAINAAGNSPTSVASAPVKPKNVPNAPVIARGESRDSKVGIYFTTPAQNGSVITSYTVTSDPEGITKTGTFSPIVVDGLTNGTEYTFTVHATNAVGSSIESAASDPITPLGVSAAPTNVVVTPGDQLVDIAFDPPTDTGGTEITSFTATAEPGGMQVSGTESPLEMTGLTNGVEYTFTVHATNIIGDSIESDPSDPVTPRTVPDAPMDVVGTPGSEHVEVAFNAPEWDGGNAITEYTVTSDPEGITATGTESPIDVTGLTNGTEYTFTVHATNEAGDSVESDASEVVVPLTVPDAPTDVEGTPGNGEVSVAFTAPDFDGGNAISSYTVIGSDGSTASGSESPIVVDGLENGTEYTFTVIATNDAGDSEESDASETVVPRDVPNAPTNVVGTAGDGEVSVAFDIPDWDGGNDITEYTVTSDPDDVTATGDGTEPIVVSGLTNGTEYTFTVHATNEAGDSVESDPSEVVIPCGVPDAPTNVVATPGNGEVSIAFDESANDNGKAITSYTVTADPGGAQASGTTSPIVMTDLDNGTEYTFTVHATNEVGDSAESDVSDAVTPFTVSDAPFNVVAVAGDEEASVSFDLPEFNGGSEITLYTVTAYVDGIPANITATGDGTGPIVITGLTNDTEYTFTVFATNAAGDGPESVESIGVTPHS